MKKRGDCGDGDDGLQPHRSDGDMLGGPLISLLRHPDGSHHGGTGAGDGRLGGDYALGLMAGAQEDWQEHDEPDMLLDEFFHILEEDPASVRETRAFDLTFRVWLRNSLQLCLQA